MSPKQKYQVYWCHAQYYDDDGIVKQWEEPIGTTYAASEAQAINNVRFRCGIKPADCHCDGWGDSYSSDSHFRAETINQ